MTNTKNESFGLAVLAAMGTQQYFNPGDKEYPCVYPAEIAPEAWTIQFGVGEPNPDGRNLNCGDFRVYAKAEDNWKAEFEVITPLDQLRAEPHWTERVEQAFRVRSAALRGPDCSGQDLALQYTLNNLPHKYLVNIVELATRENSCKVLKMRDDRASLDIYFFEDSILMYYSALNRAGSIDSGSDVEFTPNRCSILNYMPALLAELEKAEIERLAR